MISKPSTELCCNNWAISVIRLLICLVAVTAVQSFCCVETSPLRPHQQKPEFASSQIPCTPHMDVILWFHTFTRPHYIISVKYWILCKVYSCTDVLKMSYHMSCGITFSCPLLAIWYLGLFIGVAERVIKLNDECFWCQNYYKWHVFKNVW